MFDLPAGFHREFLHSAQNVTVITIRNTAARCDFEAPGGTYALAVSHDENSNGKLDTNLEGHANGRLWLFERRQSADRHVFFFCRRRLVQRTDPGHDDQLALLSARFSPRCWTLMSVTFCPLCVFRQVRETVPLNPIAANPPKSRDSAALSSAGYRSSLRPAVLNDA